MVFSPLVDYDTLIFKVQRTAYDVITNSRNWMILDLCTNNGTPPSVTPEEQPIILSEKERQLVTQENRSKIIFCEGI